MDRNPKLVSLSPPMEAAAGLTPNRATIDDVQAALLRAPNYIASLGLNEEDVANLERYRLGVGHYAHAFILLNGTVLKVTDDEDDARVCKMILELGNGKPGLPYIRSVHRLPGDVYENETDVDHERPLFAIVMEPVTPASKTGMSRTAAGVRPRLLGEAVLYPSMEPELPSDEAREFVRQIRRGIHWLAAHGVHVLDLHHDNFGYASGKRPVILDFGHGSLQDEFVMKPVEMATNPLPIDNDVATGIGATGNNQDVDYFGLRVLMKPSTFHRLVFELPRDAAPSVDWMKEQISEGRAFGAPALYVDIPSEWARDAQDDLSEPAVVYGHEGRNRMYASKELYGDDDLVEVHIFPRGIRNRDITPQWIARINSGLVSERHGRRGDRSMRETRGPLFEKVLNAQSGRSSGWRAGLATNPAKKPTERQTLTVWRDLGSPTVDMDELRMGIEVEQEHTGDMREAGKIAMDHLREFPDYYTRLTKMEARAKAGLAPNAKGSAEPRTFFHGTSAEDVDELRSGKYRVDELFITDDRNTAWLYATQKAGPDGDPVVVHLDGAILRRRGQLVPGSEAEDHEYAHLSPSKEEWEWIYSGPLRPAIVRIERRGGDDIVPNGRSMPKVRAAFDECFDALLEQFSDFGELELHQDEKAGGDNGHGSERQFGYCMDGNPIRVAFAAKTEDLPVANIRGLMAHEFGHALDYRYGDKLGKMLGQRLPAGVERRADSIAKAVFGRTIKYDGRDIQCVACQGKSVRPRRLGP